VPAALLADAALFAAGGTAAPPRAGSGAEPETIAEQAVNAAQGIAAEAPAGDEAAFGIAAPADGTPGIPSSPPSGQEGAAPANGQAGAAPCGDEASPPSGGPAQGEAPSSPDPGAPASPGGAGTTEPAPPAPAGAPSNRR
jgi:hypothetical protein